MIFLKILLSPDIEKNPGSFTNSFFTFANWNINSLAKDNFQRVQLLEAHNALFSYDLISLTEISQLRYPMFFLKIILLFPKITLLILGTEASGFSTKILYP